MVRVDENPLRVVDIRPQWMIHDMKELRQKNTKAIEIHSIHLDPGFMINVMKCQL